MKDVAKLFKADSGFIAQWEYPPTSMPVLEINVEPGLASKVRMSENGVDSICLWDEQDLAWVWREFKERSTGG